VAGNGIRFACLFQNIGGVSIHAGWDQGRLIVLDDGNSQILRTFGDKSSGALDPGDTSPTIATVTLAAGEYTVRIELVLLDDVVDTRRGTLTIEQDEQSLSVNFSAA
jgi:hypothetical protein